MKKQQNKESLRGSLNVIIITLKNNCNKIYKESIGKVETHACVDGEFEQMHRNSK